MTNVSVVLYNTPVADISALMESLQQCRGVDTIFIVDHSPDDALRQVVGEYPRVRYIKQSNTGYGSGHNEALRQSLEAGARYHAVLNPDLSWNGDVLAALEKYMDSHPDCGQVMPLIKYGDGTVQHLCKLLPTPADLILRRFVPVRSWQAKNAARYELHASGYDREMEVPSLSGCFMFLRCDVLRRIGLFDERYFMYAEDLDLCRRIGEVSRTMFWPGVEVVHGYAKESYHNRKLLKYHISSAVKYFNKWGWWLDSERNRRNRKVLAEITGNKGNGICG